MQRSADVLRKRDEEKIMIDIAEIKAKRVKATILSGFLGAGKTTFINHIIRQNQGRKIAVLVNDFGEINIDSDLIVSRDENKIDLTGGCGCCTIQKDLIASVINLMKQIDKPSHILVECSGAADPSKVLNTLSTPLLKFHLHVDGLFTIIDCSQLLKIGKEYRGLVEGQMKAANLLILNKTGLIDSQDLEKVKNFVKEISPTAAMLESIRCQVPLDLVLGFNDIPELKGDGDLKEKDINVLKANGQGTTAGILSAVPTHEAISHDLVFESWSFRSKTPFSEKAFRELLEIIPPDIIRAKGFVYWDDLKYPTVLLNLVGQWIDLDVHVKNKDSTMETRLVFIGKPGWKNRFGIESKINTCLVKNQ